MVKIATVASALQRISPETWVTDRMSSLLLTFIGPDQRKWKTLILVNFSRFWQVLICKDEEFGFWRIFSNMTDPYVRKWKISILLEFSKTFTDPDMQKWKILIFGGTSGDLKDLDLRKWKILISVKILEIWLVWTSPNFGKFHQNQNFGFSHVRTCQKYENFTEIKILDFHMSGPVKMLKISRKSKFWIFACPDLSKMWKFHRNQNFWFSHVRTCQKCENFTEIKIFDFRMSGPVKNVKISQISKFLIFACPDRSKMWKFHRNQNVWFSHVRTCQKCENFTEIKIFDFRMSGPVKNVKISPKSKFLIFACPDLSKMWKFHGNQNFVFSHVRTCPNVKISPKSKFLIFASSDMSNFEKIHRNQNFGFCHRQTCLNLRNCTKIKIFIVIYNNDLHRLLT